jgi:uncharacterized protein YPO0396
VTPPPRPTLARSASGLRHLRWAREVLGTLAALASHEARFTEAQLAALRAEVSRVSELVAALSAAVKPYRDFLERTRTLARGKVRAAEIVGDAGAREAALREMADRTEPARQALHAALSAAIDATRDGLREVDERLAATLGHEVVVSLYPNLTPDASRVLDDGDPDDDAAGAG